MAGLSEKSKKYLKDHKLSKFIKRIEELPELYYPGTETYKDDIVEELKRYIALIRRYAKTHNKNECITHTGTWWDETMIDDLTEEMLDQYIADVLFPNDKKRTAHHFDWTCFTEDDFAKIQEDIASGVTKEQEDAIYGSFRYEGKTGSYIIDIHYEHYGYDQKGFDLEVYQDADGQHGRWLTSEKSIHSSKDYKRFCRRAVNTIIGIAPFLV